MPDLSSIIEREVELTSRFVRLLTEEQDILKAGDIDALPELSGRKTPLLEQLNALEAKRMEILGTSPDSSAREAMERWLANNNEDRATGTHWKNLLAIAREAKTLHELNAQLVGMHLRRTSEILAILRQPSEDSSLYGATGQAVASTGSRLVDSA